MKKLAVLLVLSVFMVAGCQNAELENCKEKCKELEAKNKDLQITLRDTNEALRLLSEMYQNLEKENK